MLTHAQVLCLTHGRFPIPYEQLKYLIDNSLDKLPGIDGKACEFLIVETGEIYTDLITPRQLKHLLEEETDA